MFNMGFSEMLIVAAIALIVIGPKQMPEMARMIGRMLNEWKRATNDLKSTLSTDLREDIRNRKKTAEAEGVPEIPQPGASTDAGVAPVVPPSAVPSQDSGDKS